MSQLQCLIEGHIAATALGFNPPGPGIMLACPNVGFEKLQPRVSNCPIVASDICATHDEVSSSFCLLQAPPRKTADSIVTSWLIAPYLVVGAYMGFSLMTPLVSSTAGASAQDNRLHCDPVADRALPGGGRLRGRRHRSGLRVVVPAGPGACSVSVFWGQTLSLTSRKSRLAHRWASPPPRASCGGNCWPWCALQTPL